MGRGTWAVEKKISGTWTGDGSLYRPNDSYSLPKLSTQTKVDLAEGDNAYVTPSTKYLDQPMSFAWYYDDGTTKTKIDTYMDNQNDIKITDDLGNEFVGRFTSITPTRLLGQSTEKYDIRVIFTIMPILARAVENTNLICRLNSYYALSVKNLVCRVNVYYISSSKNLVSRITSLKETSKNLVSRITSRVITEKNLVSRLNVYYISTLTNLVSRITSLKEVNNNLVSRVTVSYASTTTNLVSRITVYYISTTKNLVSRITSLKETSGNVVSRIIVVAL